MKKTNKKMVCIVLVLERKYETAKETITKKVLCSTVSIASSEEEAFESYLNKVLSEKCKGFSLIQNLVYQVPFKELQDVK